MKSLYLVSLFVALLPLHGLAMTTGENNHVTVEIRPWAQSFSHYDRPSFVITVQNHGEEDIVLALDKKNVNVVYFSSDGKERYKSLFEDLDFGNPHGKTKVRGKNSIQIHYADLISGSVIEESRGTFLDPGVYRVRLFVNIREGLEEIVEKSAECYVSIRRGSEEELMQLRTIMELRKGCNRCPFVDRLKSAFAEGCAINGRQLYYIVSWIASSRSMQQDKQYFRSAIAYMNETGYLPGVDLLEGLVQGRRIASGSYDLDE
ncbi:MAG: hypothetical protein KFH87_00675 [Bacteroidetes bacterium]|nr:hypothetical protein [Bacteroidota bacterium]